MTTIGSNGIQSDLATIVSHIEFFHLPFAYKFGKTKIIVVPAQKMEIFPKKTTSYMTRVVPFNTVTQNATLAIFATVNSPLAVDLCPRVVAMSL